MCKRCVRRAWPTSEVPCSRGVRIVSLLPSATEILFAIGAGDDVAGVTHECDYPLEANQSNWTFENTVVLNVSNPQAVANNLFQETENFVTNSNVHGPEGYDFLGQNSNAYAYNGGIMAGISQSTMDAAITQLRGQVAPSGIVAIPGVYNSPSLQQHQSANFASGSNAVIYAPVSSGPMVAPVKVYGPGGTTVSITWQFSTSPGPVQIGMGTDGNTYIWNPNGTSVNVNYYGDQFITLGPGQMIAVSSSGAIVGAWTANDGLDYDGIDASLGLNGLDDPDGPLGNGVPSGGFGGGSDPFNLIPSL